MLKSIYKSAAFANALGIILAGGIRFIRATSRIVVDSPAILARRRELEPVIVGMWHGQHFLVPLAMPPGIDAAVMISRSADGSVQARAAERLRLKTIRASGAQKRHQVGKRGGAKGFLQALKALEAGTTIALTCDVPKGPARKCGTGIALLAAHSGRSVVPVAVASSRRITLKKTWDQAVISLPFSRIAIVYGDAIAVPQSAAGGDLEPYRQAIEDAMNAATERAYAIADGRADGG